MSDWTQLTEVNAFQGKIADMHTNLCASKNFLYAVARACDAGYTSRKDCAAVFLLCAENGVKAALDAVQILGKLFIGSDKTSSFSRAAVKFDLRKK